MPNKIELEMLIEKSINRINYLQRIIYFSLNSQIKFYYNDLLEEEITKFNELTSKLDNVESGFNRIFTLEELKKYDGSNGNPAYTAINGIVYAVSFNYILFLGKYFGFCAGKSIKEEVAYGIKEILDKLTKVGILI